MIWREFHPQLCQMMMNSPKDNSHINDINKKKKKRRFKVFLNKPLNNIKGKSKRNKNKSN